MNNAPNPIRRPNTQAKRQSRPQHLAGQPKPEIIAFITTVGLLVIGLLLTDALLSG